MTTISILESLARVDNICLGSCSPRSLKWGLVYEEWMDTTKLQYAWMKETNLNENEDLPGSLLDIS